MNIALSLSYIGTAYHGWQAQKNALSVSAAVSSAIEQCTGSPAALIGCGRTDAGVHAIRYVANFRTESKIPVQKLPYALNTFLPPDIAVLAARAVPETFHAAYSAVKKEYTYLLYSSPHRRPCFHLRALHYPRPLREDVIASAARGFAGTHDFACVRCAGSNVRGSVREIYDIEFAPRGELYTLRVSANGFLYNMVRNIMGTLLYVSEGKITDIPALIASRNRAAAGPTVPPHGLYMTGVTYAEGELF
jgi:tRNA pseudouridine38-40 synthase